MSADPVQPPPISPTRPQLPGYGVSEQEEGMLSWSFVSERMAASRNYWIVTARPDGRPHTTPVWGAWVDDTFYFGAGTRSRKARNLAANPNLIVHLESGDDVVILEGAARRITSMDADLYERVAAAYAVKYDGFRPDPPSEQEPFYTLDCRVVMAWQEYAFISSPTRWRF